MRAEIIQDFTFEAAHFLPRVPEGHPCRRVHGHSYRVRIHVEGMVSEATGWVMDFHDLDAVVQPALDRLDHRLLNEVPGLDNPTAELIAGWLWRELFKKLPGLCEVEVWETPGSCAVVRGPERSA